MSEPTIDEMIAWLDGLRPARIREVTAIRAILEQQREPMTGPLRDREPRIDEIMAYLDSTVQPKIDAVLAEERRGIELEAIRDLVGRVKKRVIVQWDTEFPEGLANRREKERALFLEEV
jgi:hypothetical protein